MLDAVGGRSVGQCREAGDRAYARADHGCASSGANSLNHPLHRYGGFFMRTTDRDGEIVEQKIASAIENSGGEILPVDRVEEFDEIACVVWGWFAHVMPFLGAR